jgi:uncharacterized protein (TIGR02996 family)
MHIERQAIELLAGCNFLPGSFDKRFARTLGEYKPDHRLTAKQRACLWKLVKKYRRQIRHPRFIEFAERWMNRPADIIAFEQAIDENPKDHLPRLIYADWLEEHDHVQQAITQRWMCRNNTLPFLQEITHRLQGVEFEWTFGRFSNFIRQAWWDSREEAEKAMAELIDNLGENLRGDFVMMSSET